MPRSGRSDGGNVIDHTFLGSEHACLAGRPSAFRTCCRRRCGTTLTVIRVQNILQMSSKLTGDHQNTCKLHVRKKDERMLQKRTQKAVLGIVVLAAAIVGLVPESASARRV